MATPQQNSNASTSALPSANQPRPVHAHVRIEDMSHVHAVTIESNQGKIVRLAPFPTTTTTTTNNNKPPYTFYRFHTQVIHYKPYPHAVDATTPSLGRSDADVRFTFDALSAVDKINRDADILNIPVDQVDIWGRFQGQSPPYVLRFATYENNSNGSGRADWYTTGHVQINGVPGGFGYDEEKTESENARKAKKLEMGMESTDGEGVSRLEEVASVRMRQQLQRSRL